MKKINIIIAFLLLFSIKVNAQYVLPSGGESLEDWYLGNTVNISWVINLITNNETNRVNVELWNGSDNTSTIIAENILDLGNLQFQIPQSTKPDKRYKIRIKNLGENSEMINDDYIIITQFPSKDNSNDTIPKINNLLKVYPNPALDIMYIEFSIPKNFDYNLQFFDNIGKKLDNLMSKVEIINSNVVKITLDLTRVSNGKYYFIYNNDSSPRLVQFIKN
jgi:hypothetical protein